MVRFIHQKCIKMHVRASWFSKIFQGNLRIPERKGWEKARGGNRHPPKVDLNRRPWHVRNHEGMDHSIVPFRGAAILQPLQQCIYL